jgi:anti-sigma-K factor RskA
MTDDELHSQSYLYVIGALDPDETREFEAHLAGCADCRKEVADMYEVTAQLSEMVAAEPPAELRSAVLAEISTTAQDRAPAARGRHAGPAAAAEATSHATVVPIRRPWRERVSILVAAAAVLGAVGVGTWALNERNDARDEAAAARSQAATAKEVADELTRILNGGDAQTVSTSTDNGAVATVVRSQKQGAALLLATGLPTLPTGKTYQAWTIDNDKPTSAGTFESQGEQTAYELPPAAVQTGIVAVTIEPAGGSDQPTTKPIVALTLS